MISMLNQANRNGRVSSTVLEKLKETGQFLRDELFSPSLKARLNTSNADHMTILVDERLVHIPWKCFMTGSSFYASGLRWGDWSKPNTRSTMFINSRERDLYGS